MSRVLQSALQRLLQAEPPQLSLSQLTLAQRTALADFASRTGALQQQRQGRGSVFRVLNRAVIEQHLSDFGTDTEPDTGLPQRAMNIARQRSTKAGQHRHALTYLLTKGVNGAIWTRQDGVELDLHQHTRRYGAGVITLGESENDNWVTEGTLWLVENQAVFDRLDWLPDQQPATIVWYRGQLQNSIIDWLATRPRAAGVIIFPDYDGVGLQNYLRLKQALQQQLRLWLMPGWQQKLQAFGNNQLWQNSAAEFAAAAQEIIKQQGFDEPAVLELLQAMQTSGLALEQEAIWLPVQS